MKRLLSPIIQKIKRICTMPELKPLDEYGIPKRPQHNVKVEKTTRTTTTKVNNGKAQYETVDGDGSIVTTIGKQKPKTPKDVQIDNFDVAFLDFGVGVKWKKDPERAAIMKWHWMQSHSAKQIETEHTDKTTNQLERGYSERTAAEYIQAFYNADDEREREKVPRLRSPRGAENIVEW